MWIYTTPAVTSHIFHSSDPTSTAYNDGADLVSNLFGIYNGIAALAALFLPLLARKTSRRVTHFIALTCGGIGLISFYFISDPFWLWFSMIGVGIAWASILSVPYAMLSGSLPPQKMGYYMGVFNFFIVIPQIIAGTVLGFLLVHVFDGQPIFILVSGGISILIAGLLSLRVSDQEEVVIRGK
jgi:maltose/moltooligosaccharide transporter